MMNPLEIRRVNVKNHISQYMNAEDRLAMRKENYQRETVRFKYSVVAFICGVTLILHVIIALLGGCSA